jgi:hypothetical protein
MSTVAEIKAAIAALSPAKRAELQDWLLAQAERPAPTRTKVPDQSARRRRILGTKVLPNIVVEARHADER